MRDFVIAFDTELSQIGFAERDSELCQVAPGNLVYFNQHPLLTLVATVLLLVLSLLLLGLSCKGCFVFYDFGETLQQLGRRNQ